MLLTEYDEQAHIENEKEIAREEGRAEGREEGKEEEGCLMADLVKRLKDDGRLEDLDVLGDRKARRKLYEEYHLIN